MKVEVKGKQYDLLFSYGALYRFEAATGGETYDPGSLLHLHAMIYAALDASNPGNAPFSTFDEFSAALDSEPGLARKLTTALSAEFAKWETLQKAEENTEDGDNAKKNA